MRYDLDPLTCMHCQTPEPIQHTQACLPGYHHGFITRKPGQSNAEAQAAYQAKRAASLTLGLDPPSILTTMLGQYAADKALPDVGSEPALRNFNGDAQIVRWIREDTEAALDGLIAGDIDQVTESLKAIYSYTYSLLNDSPEEDEAEKALGAETAYPAPMAAHEAAWLQGDRFNA